MRNANTQQEDRTSSRDAVIAAFDKSLYVYGVELAQAYLHNYPKDGFILIELAWVFAQLSRYAEAEVAFDRALELEHASEKWRKVIFIQRGQMYMRQGQPLRAEECYRNAIELNPNDAAHYVYLGVSIFRRGDLALAEQILRKGAACGGECSDESYANLGGVLVAQQRYEEALECYQKALELDPDYKWVKLRLRDVKKVLRFKSEK